MEENAIWYPRAEGEYPRKDNFGRPPPQSWGSDLTGKGIVAIYWLAEEFTRLHRPELENQENQECWRQKNAA